MNNLTKQLTIKYSLLQSTYWISQCIIGGFAAVFLRSKSFNNSQIGIVLSLSLVLSVILQLLIATFADKTKKVALRTIVIALMFFVATLILIMYIAPSSFVLIAVNFCLVSAIQSTLNPLLNSLAVEYINKGFNVNYGLSRGTGSISFALTSYLFGMYVTNFGVNTLLLIFMFFYCFVIIATFAFKINLPEQNLSASQFIKDDNTINESQNSNRSQEEKSSIAPAGIIEFFIKYKNFSIQLIGIAMLFFSHNIICTYLINIIENVGGNSTDMGISLAIAATVELPTMATFIYIVRKITCNTLIKISSFFFFIKAAILWLAPNVYIVHLSQAIQMFAYALFTPASVYYVNSIIEEQDKVKGQSMLGVAMSIAGIIANISGGKILDTLGVSEMLFLGTITTAFGFIIIFLSTKNVESKCAVAEC